MTTFLFLLNKTLQDLNSFRWLWDTWWEVMCEFSRCDNAARSLPVWPRSTIFLSMEPWISSKQVYCTCRCQFEKFVRKFLNNYFTPDSFQSVAHKDNCLHFKLTYMYIGPFSIIHVTQRRIKKLVNTFCSDMEIKLVFTLFKIKSCFGAEDPIPVGLRSWVIHKFSCAGCTACYSTLEEAMHIHWEQPSLNSQNKHLNIYPYHTT